MEKFLIIKDTFKKSPRFGLQARNLEFKIKPIPTGTEPSSWIRDAIEGIITTATEGLDPNDQVGFTFCSKEFARGEGWMHFRPASKISFNDIWEQISSIYQSNSSGLDTETFCLNSTSVKMPVGKGKGKQYSTFQEECKSRKGIISIRNNDNLCLPRALVVAISHKNNDPDYKNKKIIKDTAKIQTKRALQLLEKSRIIIPHDGSGIFELQKFQDYLTGYNITVYKYGSKGRDVIFTGNKKEPCLNLLFHKGHFNVITSVTSAFCSGYFCEKCHQPYNNKNQHRCGGVCFACRSTPACPNKEVKIRCSECNRLFYGDTCYKNHLDSVCSQIKRCIECYKIYFKTHACGEIYCKICQKKQPEGHLCYIQPDTGSPKTKDILFITYDLETRQETIREEILIKNRKEEVKSSRLHEPNLCVYNKTCSNCVNETNLYYCQVCGIKVVVLQEDVITSFMKELLTLRKAFKNLYVIGHNSGGFDNIFLLNHILTKTDLKPELIMRGTRTILMQVGNIKFLDSLNYFPMALNKLPKSFGLTELKKGYFPHLFNRSENANYIGKIPSLEFYDYDNMKSGPENDVGTRENFLKWYQERKDENYVFDFQKEIVEYCKSDVNILSQACFKFRKQMMKATNVCPFTECLTIASTCSKVFRRNFLKPETIAIIPKGGYRWRDTQSKIAIQWLVWEEKIRNINIQHSAKSSEAIVNGVKVDGFCAETNQIFEFQGCYFHGCVSCYRYSRNKVLPDSSFESMDIRYENTLAKIEHLQNKGFEVIQMWECEFRNQLAENLQVQRYTENHPLLQILPLNPRDALYGGRTGNTVEYYKAKDGEKIKYIDVCSLYPWACKYGKFPKGHPKNIYVGEECLDISLTSISGVIHCRVLPPTNLYHPVLPMKMNNKLMFVLCRSCGEQNYDDTCQHTIDERSLTGTWVIEEVVKALEKGYQIINIYEIWDYETIQLSTNQAGLFSDMINKFLQIKQQASGWPKNCKTDEEKDQYIGEFFNRENVKLEYSKIIDNPGLRSLAKLLLNSFWGKFAQRENQNQTSILNEPGEFFNMLVNPSIYVNTVLPVNDETLVVNWCLKEEAYNISNTANVIIAAYVTTIARLKLYSYLEQLGNRVLYYDTDSIIYTSKEEEYDIPTGSFLGDMTDEVETYGTGSYITEFVSGGPKNYAFKIFSPNNDAKPESVVCKVKGIQLNYSTSEKINFNSIKEMVLKKTEPLIITSKQICRTKEYEVLTKTVKKTYKTNSTKRKFFEDHTSLPFGYKRHKN